ncbi:hypothetical protein GCM10010112_09590 [Actinoplanes lobatus]|uniref:Uncharacterized protein n=1 Tax=Actinoplanes lobatus TaxID=113568 RepID=A0A7W7HD93_9ACTN|nr:hypothetical protein [Actinoplanes lobatus]MBB4748423.1 hypothetical protein [Actinoplanes lobatus]GGN57105.1 hypothetical protein GCM10010112_09590 [Actinoplanes lobatus]GIE37675.1 hypothetical protein Alo02nite_05730 [Actinoplanes lobatus]
MSDQLEEIFARTRPTAVQAIRPPGAEAARRTVRIRRRRRAVGLAAVLVLAVVGGVLVRKPAPGPSLPADPVRLTQTAKVALGTSTLPAAVEKAAEVTPNWSSSSPVYHGELTLRAACAGAGEITLAVIGNPGSESSQTEPFELARLKVPCSQRPEPVETAFEPSGAINLDYKIVESTIASRSAGFAYRLTSDTGKPFAMGDDQANPTAALHLTSDEGFGTGGSLSARRPGWKDDLPSHVGGDFRILAACTGDGTLVVEILKKSGKVVDTVRVPCHWPPKRYDFEPARGTGDLYYRISYKHITMPSTDFAVQFVPK